MSVTADTSVQTIDQRQLKGISSRLAARHELRAPAWNRRAPLLEGYMRLTEVQPGMLVRISNVRDRYDLVSEAILRPGIQLALVLDGQARVCFGNRQLSLGPDSKGPHAAQAMLVSLTRPEKFNRFGQAGGHEQTMTITLTPTWLQRHLATFPYEEAFMARLERHLSMTTWSPSSALLALVQQLFDSHMETEQEASLAQRLRIESCALAFISEGLVALRDPTDNLPAPAQGGTHKYRRLKRLRELIDNGEADRLTQGELAARLNMSQSSLQRLFRTHFGVSLGRYLRQHRLNTAHQALCHGGVSVETAAALAGYTSAANFATAFKRQFGTSPSQCRDGHC